MYHTIIFNPLYNGLIGLFDLFPWMDAGVAVILFTIIVRLILYPLSKKAITAQVKMKQLEPQLNKIKALHKGNTQEQSLQTMALYKQSGVNPFSGFLLLIIQLPILWALYSIFVRSGLPTVNPAFLYHYVSVPVINMHFLGLLDISKRSIILSLCASAAQFLQLHFSIATSGVRTPTAAGAAPGASDIAQNMSRQMKYIFPVMIFFISYRISAVIALYWTVSNIFTLVQELVVRRRLHISN